MSWATHLRAAISHAFVALIVAAPCTALAQPAAPEGMPDPIWLTMDATPTPTELEVLERAPRTADGASENRWRTLCSSSAGRPCALWVPRASVLRANGPFPAGRPFRLPKSEAANVTVRPGASPGPAIVVASVGGAAFFVGLSYCLLATLPHSDDRYATTVEDRNEAVNRKLITGGVISGAGLAVVIVGGVLLLTGDETRVDLRGGGLGSAFRARPSPGFRLGSGQWFSANGLRF